MTIDSERRARDAHIDTWRTYGAAAGGEFVEADGLLTYFSGASSANFNPTIVAGPVADPVAALTARAALYAERACGFGVDLVAGFDDDVERAAVSIGMTLRVEQPAMALDDVSDLPPIDPSVREAGVDDLDRYLQGQAAGFGDGLDQLRLFSPPQALRGCRLFYVTGENDDVVATSLTCVAGPNAGIFGVATRPEWRRRGLGARLTLAAARAAADDGADFVFLHASEMGRPVYERIGFRAVGANRIYVEP